MALLQKFGFRESRYQRPQDKWVCGHLADGKPCALGPDGQGRCRASGVCRPRFEDGRWECRRSTQEGGPCVCGPRPDGACGIQLEPCQPRLSLRARRGRVTRWAAALAVGLVVLIVGGSEASRLLMPGPLSAPHASQTQCSTCHAGLGDGPLGFLHSFAASTGASGNARLCLSCHDVGETPFSPHTHPVEDLARLTREISSRDGDGSDGSWVNRIAFEGPRKTEETGQPEIFCATCHQEHQGGLHDLTTVSNARCQTCHVAKFGSFAASHPQFGDYPFDRRMRLIFDHKSHFGKHFPDTIETATAQAAQQTAGDGASSASPVPDTCADCHTPGPDRRYMETKSYEVMCQSCHDGDIMGTSRAAGPKGIDFLAVPGLDLLTLEERGIDIGQWPRHAEAGITPFLRLLLAAEASDDDPAEGLSGLDLLDLRSASEEELRHVATLAWSVKGLFANLEDARLSKTMEMSDMSGTPMGHGEMARLTGLIAHDVIQGANRDWFPDLRDDLARHAKGEHTASFTPPAPPEPEPAAKTPNDAAGILDAPQTDILGSGDNTSGDDILGTPANDDILGDTATPQTDILGGGTDDAGDILGTPADDDGLGRPTSDDEPGKTAEGGDILGVQTEPAEDILGGDESGDAILGGDTGGESILGGAEAGADILGADDADDILSGAGADDILGGGDGSPAEEGGGLLSADGAAPSAPEPAAEPEPFNPEAWAEFGGWYRQDFTIRYRPTGHADRFLRAWLDYAGHAYGTTQEALLTPIFAKLSPEDAVGRCTRCHSVDDENGTRHIKWRGFYSDRVAGRFTVFSHEPHLSAVGEEGCAACHTLTPGGSGNFMKTYSGFDPSVFAKTFKSVDKALCATCHTEKAAGEDCTLCHAYHATEFARPMVETKLP